MSHRPTEFYKDRTWTWDIRLTNIAGSAVNADSNPTITVYKGGVPTGESVTVTKPDATTGWYQCSFEPAGEAEGDVYGFAEVAIIAGITYPPWHWYAVVKIPAPTVTQIRQEMDSNSTKLDVTVGSRLATAGYTAPPTVAQIEAAFLDEEDGRALLQAISAQVQTLFDGGADIPVATLVDLISTEVASTLATDHGAGSWEGVSDAATSTQLTTLINSVLAKLPAALVGGRIDAYVGAMGTDVMTVAAASEALVDWIQEAAATPAQVTAAAQSVITHGDGVGGWAGGSDSGPGEDPVTITIEDDSVGIPGVEVWVTSDAGGTTVIAGSSWTNDSGEVIFLLQDGVTYYLWAKKAGKISIRGTAFVAEAD